jgi:hypothetical protein
VDDPGGGCGELGHLIGIVMRKIEFIDDESFDSDVNGDDYDNNNNNNTYDDDDIAGGRAIKGVQLVM